MERVRARARITDEPKRRAPDHGRPRQRKKLSALRVESVTVRRGERLILDNVAFSARPGRVTGFLGPNGAGKTTTLSVLAQVIQPEAGSVTIDGGQPLARGDVGYSPQEVALYPFLTASENLTVLARYLGIPRRERREAVSRGLRMAGLAERASEPVARFSGGMRRRLSVAGATLHAPKVLLLDEPTSGVDPQARSYLLEAIGGMAVQTGAVVICSTHYMEEVEAIGDDAVIIDEGRVVAASSVDRLRASAASYITMQVRRCDNSFMRRLKRLGTIEEVARSTYRLRARDSTTCVPRAIAAVRQAGGSLIDLHVEEPSLGNVFLELTGKSLRD